MPTLTDQQRNSLDPGNHNLRGGFNVPGTGNGPLFEASCACWALFGRFVPDAQATHPSSVYFGLFNEAEHDIGLYQHPRGKDDVVNEGMHNKMRIVAIPASINETGGGLPRYDAKYPGLTAAIRHNFNQAVADSLQQLETFKQGGADGFNPGLLAGRNPFKEVRTDAQINIKKALMEIAAREAGLTLSPGQAPTNYRLIMVTSAWYGWDHWAIGVLANGWESVVQTVPSVPICYGCNTIWDEHFTRHDLYLSELQQAHVDTLAAVNPQQPVQTSDESMSTVSTLLLAGGAAGLAAVTFWAYMRSKGSPNDSPNCVIM